MIKKVKLEIPLEVIKNVRKKTKDGGEMIQMVERYNVKGMMKIISRCLSGNEKQRLLDEYVKFAILDKIGVKVYPLEK